MSTMSPVSSSSATNWCGRLQAVLGIVPAQQRFGADHSRRCARRPWAGSARRTALRRRSAAADSRSTSERASSTFMSGAWNRNGFGRRARDFARRLGVAKQRRRRRRRRTDAARRRPSRQVAASRPARRIGTPTICARMRSTSLRDLRAIGQPSARGRTRRRRFAPAARVPGRRRAGAARPRAARRRRPPGRSCR